MNYIQVKDFGGADRGLKFNNISLKAYLEHIKFEDANSVVYACFYAGMVGNYFVKGLEEDFTFEDVCDWVDKLHADGRQEEIDAVCKMWSEVDAFKKVFVQFQPEIRASLDPEVIDKKKVRTKKNLTGSKSKKLPLEN